MSANWQPKDRMMIDGEIMSVEAGLALIRQHKRPALQLVEKPAPLPRNKYAPGETVEIMPGWTLPGIPVKPVTVEIMRWVRGNVYGARLYNPATKTPIYTDCGFYVTVKDKAKTLEAAA